jgi:hypothetical protein
MNDNTYYVQAVDDLGRKIGRYLDAADFDEAYDRALEHEDISVVQAVQLVSEATV